jgi:hypothetical protein
MTRTSCGPARRILLGIFGLTVFSLGLDASVANATFMLGDSANFIVLFEGAGKTI